MTASTFTPSHRGGAGTPMVCLHGFIDTWRTWELVLPALERDHDVLAPTLAGHAGGPPIDGPVSEAVLADAVERAMDEAGFETAHIVGNSLGGYVALQLAARGRARSVVALAPAGGWAVRDGALRDTLGYFTTMQELLRAARSRRGGDPRLAGGRRRATEFTVTNFEHIPVELLAHQIRGAAALRRPASPLIEHAIAPAGACDARADRLPGAGRLGHAPTGSSPGPSAAARFRAEWLPQADWVELDGIGHCPQLDVPLETAQLILDFTRD